MTVSKVVLAKLSPTMEEGTIVKWTKKEGDAVKQGDVLAEIETDKANMEMEALGSGVLRKILVPAGGKAPIGALIGVIAEPNEDIEPLIAKEGAKAGGAPKPAAGASTPAPPAPSITPGQELPLSNMRKTIAKRLSESMFTSPHYYVTVEVDMDAAVDLRDQIQRLEEGKVSFNDLVVKACARALTRFPLVNASWGGDKIVTHAEVNVGIAVAIPDGLITPLVRNADPKAILDIAREVRDLATRARDKKLKPEEFTGSTFTISNLGMFDVEEVTAIINPPDSAILAVGAVRKVPVVDGETIRPGHRMKVTMSADHRVIDGALSAQFLAEVRRLLEAPVGLLLG